MNLEIANDRTFTRMVSSKRGCSKEITLAVAVAISLSLVQFMSNYYLIISDRANPIDMSIFPTNFVLNSSQTNPSRTAEIRSVPTTAFQDNTQGLKNLLLSVPFYVYEELIWDDIQWGGKPILEFIYGSQPKHTDDYWFRTNALNHPMRTTNASKAKLFVIPSLHNIFDSRIFFKTHDLCVESLCNGELMLSAAKIVTSSLQFQTHPEAHLAVVSHFAHHKSWWTKGMPKLYLTMLQQSSNIHFEDFPTNRGWSVPKLHVGRACPLPTNNNKTHDVALIATFKPNDERFRDRETICTWLQKNPSKFQMEKCGMGNMCPSLANAKLGFHVRGDTPSSSRLFDTILSGTVPIFTLKKQYHVLPAWIDWKKISYFMDMQTLNETQFVNELSAILQDNKTYQRKLELLLANRHLFDWTGLYPFDTYMYMLQAHLYPDLRHNLTTFFSSNSATSILR